MAEVKVRKRRVKDERRSGNRKSEWIWENDGDGDRFEGRGYGGGAESTERAGRTSQRAMDGWSEWLRDGTDSAKSGGASRQWIFEKDKSEYKK